MIWAEFSDLLSKRLIPTIRQALVRLPGRQVDRYERIVATDIRKGNPERRTVVSIVWSGEL